MYDSFYELPSSGSLDPAPYNSDYAPSDYDLNYNAWSIDLVYQWNFAPGSEVNVVWKNQLFQQTQAGEIPGYALPQTYGNNFAQMLESGFFNSLSIRLVSFIDYSRLKQGLRGFEK